MVMWNQFILILGQEKKFCLTYIIYNTMYIFSTVDKLGGKKIKFYFPPVKCWACYILEFWMNLKTLWALQQLSITNSQSLFKLMSIELVMLSNHLIHYHPLLLLPSIFPSIRVFSNESVLCIRWPKSWFASGGQSIGASASASVLPMNIQEWLL